MSFQIITPPLHLEPTIVGLKNHSSTYGHTLRCVDNNYGELVIIRKLTTQRSGFLNT